VVNLVQDGVNGADTALAEVKPLLIVVAGAPGAGKTTFYESKLQTVFRNVLKASASPLEQAQVDEQQSRFLKESKSFVYVSSLVDLELLRLARSSGFETKVVFIGTEHPDLNTARVLARVSRGGPFAALAAIPEEHEKGLRDLPAIRKAVDELILLDNTSEGRGHRVVAQFAKGEIVKLARSVPEWAQKPFGKEFTKWLAQERRVHERAR
jgi:predicted ABC-type ATPase